jgi:hypothetical protein
MRQTGLILLETVSEKYQSRSLQCLSFNARSHRAFCAFRNLDEQCRSRLHRVPGFPRPPVSSFDGNVALSQQSTKGSIGLTKGLAETSVSRDNRKGQK